MTLLAFADRVQETAQNVGTASSVTLLGAAAGNLRTFADAGLTGKTVPYALQHRNSGQWEIGYGIYALGGLTRAVVFCNSDGTSSLVNFSAGIVDVWNDLPAEKIVAQDADSTHVTLPGGITVNGPIVATGPISAPGGITGPVAWTSITGTPTTIAGYGITDAYTKSASDARFAPIAVPWLSITGTPTTLAGYGITDAFTKTQSDARYLQTAATVPWGMVTGTPTTLNGYGITDAYTKAQADAKFALTPTPWATITGTPTTLFGYGITDAYTKTTSDALYAFKGGPFAWSGVTGTPTTLAGYGITDAFTKTESDARYALSSGTYVTSITGTAGRIAVTGTASAPVVNIDPAYIGQFSLTTLGTITTGVWNGAVIATTFGGTGLAAYAAGDLLFASAANTLAKRTIGTPNQFLAVAGGFPAWHTLVAADISDLATAGTGITVVGTITTGTWHGTPIEPAYGGTGLTSYAKGDLLYASAVNTLANLVVGGAAQVLAVTAGVPAWHTLVTADITDLATAATGITKLGTVTTGVWNATTIAPLNGGTGLTAYGPGDIIYGSGINTLARLAGPTAITRTFLMSAGTGAAANPPIWTTITAADVSGLTAANIGAGTFGGAAYTFSGNVTVSGTLTTGAVTASSIHVTGPLTVDGAVTFNGGVTTTGAISGGVITASPNIVVTGTAAQSRGLAIQTGGSNRWYLDAAGVEGGSNAGSDFALNAYTDGAVLIDSPITIQRAAAGPMVFSRPTTVVNGLTVGAFLISSPEVYRSAPDSYLRLAGGNAAGVGANVIVFAQSHPTAANTIQLNAVGGIGVTGDITIAPTYKLVLNSAVASGQPAIQLQAGGAPRWNIRRSGNPESGGSAGSDFVIETYSDSGALGDQPVFIARSPTGPIYLGINGTRPVVVGADPGGAEIVRVGGNTRIGTTAGSVSLTLVGKGAGGGNCFLVFNSGPTLAPWLVGRGPADNSDNFQIYDQVGARIALTCVSGSSAVVVGPDPGGTQIFRVNGGLRATIFSDNGYAGTFTNSSTNLPFGVSAQFTATAPNNSSTVFYAAADSTTVRFEVLGNGGIGNYSANNLNLSDASIKHVGALVDPILWWHRIAALEVRAFKYVDQTHPDDNIGLIAQQVEQVAPELVCDIEWGETALKAIYSADLDYAHLAVTQELQRRVLALEARLAATHAHLPQ